MSVCGGYEDMISAMADGELADDELAQLRPHIDSCPSCARRLGLYELVSRCVHSQEIDAPSALAEHVMDKVARMPSPRAEAPALAAASAPHTYRRPGPPAPARSQARNSRNLRRLLPVAAAVLLMFVLKARLPEIRARQARSGTPPVSVPAPRPSASSPSAHYEGDGAEAGSEAMFSPAADMAGGAEEYVEQPADTLNDMPDASYSTATGDDYAAAPAELYGAVTVTGDLPEMLLGRAMLETDYGVYALLATRDEADYLIALGYEASLAGPLSQGTVAIILYSPGQ